MKFLNTLRVLAIAGFILMNLVQVWAEAHSVSFGNNGTVYYKSGASQQEAQLLADYLQELKVDNSDWQVERVPETKTVLVKFIPVEGVAMAELNGFAQELEQKVFDENVIVAVCDNKLRVLYKSAGR